MPTIANRGAARLAVTVALVALVTSGCGGVQQWAFCSLQESAWARAFDDAQRGRGKTHQAALRALGNRWLEVLWHCLRKGVLDDEAVYVANRNRALRKAA